MCKLVYFKNKVKTEMATFWSIFLNFGLLFIPRSCHTAHMTDDYVHYPDWMRTPTLRSPMD